MSLPAETKFPCVATSTDSMTVDFTYSMFMEFWAQMGEAEAGVVFGRAQVESLRDQLTEWLEAGE